MILTLIVLLLGSTFLWGLDICSPVIVFSLFSFTFLSDGNFDVYGKARYWLLYLPYIFCFILCVLLVLLYSVIVLVL
ncbi:hypothetical protein K440DRAFT_324047 [Wilcoxina mikolae CBS 423.85]|nr:hypothetical protein K440DRAFT_324047 [Wilcoxina mikolae CBS 423.85]